MRTHYRPGSSNQRGAALVVGLIMLVLITIMLVSAMVLSTSNFRSVSNMQFREEALAAGMSKAVLDRMGTTASVVG